MKVSIIIPVYKVEEYLPQCVDSILNQTYRDMEIILVDDDSPDNSGKICDQYAQKDERIQVIHKPNGGLSDARNAGLRQATGKYVMFVDSDDFWMDNKGLQKLVDIVTKQPQLDFIGFNCSYYYPLKEIYSQWVYYSEKITNAGNRDSLVVELVRSGTFPMSACLKLIRREYLIKYQLYFKKGLISEDIPWFIELLDKAENYKFVNLYLYAYRQDRQGSITNGFTEKAFNDLFGIVKHELEVLPDRSFKEQTKVALKSFLAYEFCILLSQLRYFTGNKRKEKRKDLLVYRGLLKYTENPKVKLVNHVNNIVGLGITEKILNLFMMTK